MTKIFKHSPAPDDTIKVEQSLRLGAGIVGTRAGDMTGEIVLAIEISADVVNICKTIHPSPDAGEEHWDGGSRGAR